MVNITSPPPDSSAPLGGSAPAAGRRDRGIAAIGALFILVGMPVGWLSGGNNSTGDVVGCIVVALVDLAILGWLVGVFVPRERTAAPGRASRNALILAVLALVTCVVFWTGVPIALGAGALALGLWLRETAAEARGKATVVIVLGAFAMLASFVVLLIG
jgi:hypothetical protein